MHASFFPKLLFINFMVFYSRLGAAGGWRPPSRTMSLSSLYSHASQVISPHSPLYLLWQGQGAGGGARNTRDWLPRHPFRDPCQTHFTRIMWPENVLLKMVKRSPPWHVSGVAGAREALCLRRLGVVALMRVFIIIIFISLLGLVLLLFFFFRKNLLSFTLYLEGGGEASGYQPSVAGAQNS